MSEVEGREFHDEWCPKNGCRCGKCQCGEFTDCPAPAPVVSAGDEGVGLREDEREALAVALREAVDHGDACTCCPYLIADLAPAVEKLIAARVAEAGARAEGRVEWGHAHADDMVTVAARSEADARATVDGWNERWNSDGKGVLMSRVVGEWEPTQ